MIIKGRAVGLESEPVWESPLPQDAAATVAADLEAVRGDWRHRPAPVSGYLLSLVYNTDTGILVVEMSPQDPDEPPLRAPGHAVPIFAGADPVATVTAAHEAAMVEQAATADYQRFRERMFVALGVDTDSDEYKAVAADGIPDHWSDAAPDLDAHLEQMRAMFAEGVPLGAFLTAEQRAELEAAGVDVATLAVAFNASPETKGADT